MQANRIMDMRRIRVFLKGFGHEDCENVINVINMLSAAATGDSEGHPGEDEERRERAGGAPEEPAVTQGLTHIHTCRNAKAFLENNIWIFIIFNTSCMGSRRQPWLFWRRVKLCLQTFQSIWRRQKQR